LELEKAMLPDHMDVVDVLFVAIGALATTGFAMASHNNYLVMPLLPVGFMLGIAVSRLLKRVCGGLRLNGLDITLMLIGLCCGLAPACSSGILDYGMNKVLAAATLGMLLGLVTSRAIRRVFRNREAQGEVK
jgi:hypothetical protein